METINEKEYECRGSRIPFQIYYRRAINAVKRIKYSNVEMDVELCLMNTQSKKLFDIEKLIRKAVMKGLINIYLFKWFKFQPPLVKKVALF
jgi:hypothetical protein